MTPTSRPKSRGCSAKPAPGRCPCGTASPRGVNRGPSCRRAANRRRARSRLHLKWLSALVALPIVAWWYVFLVVAPKQYSDYVETARSYYERR